MELHVNGTTHRVDAGAEESLLSVLRDRLDLTGSKYGCGEGQCGACTVLLDGVPTRSCTVPAGQAEGRKVTTIEGLAGPGRLHRVQEAFLEADAFQCGYCTAGMILSAAALLDENPAPTRQEIVSAMDGHICRCGIYPRVITAIHNAANAQPGGGT